MRQLIFIIALTLTNCCIGQEKLVIGNSSKVMYSPAQSFEELDSLVVVSENGNLTFCDYIEVYYDDKLSMLAYQSFPSNDTCYTEDFYRNGQLKQRISYFNFDHQFPRSHYSEQYCKNGQLIFKGLTSGSSEPMLLTNYYCNGQKRLEFTRIKWRADGKMTWWYENGNLMYEFYYDNDVEVGEWKYYKSDGTLESTEVYDNGELIKKIKE